MIAGAQLIAALARDQELAVALRGLPARSSRVLACDWSAWGDCLVGAPAAFIAGRGYGLGSAREIALKASEILGRGPPAAISPATPVLVLRQNDEAAAAVDELIRNLKDAGETVFAAGGSAGTLPWIGDGHPMCDPILMLIPAYRAIEKAARRSGLDPDKPPHLSKVTYTL
jgi:glucosamine--fructose-6-phosphate aminotransferase (isomerizing)